MQNHSTKTRKKTPAIKGRKPETQHVWILIHDLKPSPENDAIYKPVDPADRDIVSLAKSIAARGLLEPIVVTADRFIVSGHRRLAAAKVAGIETVPCRVLPIKRGDNPDEFVRLLREHNRQREKTNAERLREEIITASEEDAVAELWSYRREKAAVQVAAIKPGTGRARSASSSAKQPMLQAVQAVIESRREFWPLSDRQIHYAILNDPPLRHASKPGSTYRNDRASYGDLCDLLTRARLAGDIPFEAIGDETRPVELWQVYENVRPFVTLERDHAFRNYWRDLMQSQINHFEIVGEKNTIGSILRPVAMEYTIPITIGRGYCSLPPRHAMAERFRASGKEKLVLLFASDFDPEGEDIAASFARSMRDDFGIEEVHAIKAALTFEQVREHKLPPIMKAKQRDKGRGKKFVSKYGEDVFELEALPPETLQAILRQHIEAVIDRDAFDAEIEAERRDAKFLAGVRNTVNDVLSDIDFEEGAA